jgi:hypothetical protein
MGGLSVGTIEVLGLAIDAAIAALICWGLASLFRFQRPITATLLSALPLPLLLIGVMYWGMFQPNPDHHDLPGLAVLGAISLAPVLYVVGLIGAGVVAASLSLARKDRLRRAAEPDPDA